MNLIQVQDRLKDMPTQAIMSYANGSNPEVPPYLALGELNRRKQMEQKHAEAPQGTVKDQIEQSVKLAQAQKAAQAQGQQKMTEAMGAQQSPVPGGTPQPQEQPEAGIAQLPTGPMNFRDGGIVSFQGANESLVDQNMPSDEESQFMKDLKKVGNFFTGGKSLEERVADRRNFEKQIQAAGPLAYLTSSADEYARAKADQMQAARNKSAAPETSAPELAAASAFASQGAPAKALPPTTQRPPSVGQGGGGRAPGGAPQAGGPPVAVDPFARLMGQVEGQTLKLPKSPDVLRAERAKDDPYLNEQPGSKLEEMHTRILQRDEEDRARFLKNEEERKQGRLNRGLMAGAEATRGQGGLGALGSFFMGFNKAGEAEDESAKTRMDAQRAMERQQEVLRAEVLSKIQDARIARSEGRLKDAVGFEKDAAMAENTFNQNKLTQLTSLATALENRRHNIATEEGQREQLRYTRMAAAKGPEIEQVFNFLAKQFPDKDPAALLEMAVKNTRPGIAGDAAANTKLIAAEAKIREKYATQKTIFKGAELARIEALEKKEIDDLRRSAQGIGGLDTSDPNAGFTVKGVK